MATRTVQNYIDGRWLDASGGDTFENIDPATGELIANVAKSTVADVDRAVDAARRALDGWRLYPAPKRGEILFRAGEIMLTRKDDLAREMTREMGKVLAEARGDDITELAAPLAGDVIRHVDALLDIPAGFGEDLAHLAGHFPGEVVLPCEHDLAGSVEDLAALWGGIETPTVEGAPRGVHRAV